jgi:hypothetical protein
MLRLDRGRDGAGNAHLVGSASPAKPALMVDPPRSTTTMSFRVPLIFRMTLGARAAVWGPERKIIASSKPDAPRANRQTEGGTPKIGLTDPHTAIARLQR